MRGKKLTVLLLFLIILLAGFLRFYNLEEESLGTDESYSLNATKGSMNLVFEKINKESAPPLYYLTIRSWNNMFGTSEFSMRFLSALLGTITVLLFFFIVKSFFGDKTAFYSSLLLSVSMLNVLYSQEARFYTISLFFVMLSTYFLTRIINRKNNKLNYALFVISSVLSIHLNYLSAIPFLLQAGYIYFYKKERFKEILKYCFIPSALISLLVVPSLILQMINAVSSWQQRFISMGFSSLIRYAATFMMFFMFFIVLILFFVVFTSKNFRELLKKSYNFWTTFIFVLIFCAAFIALYDAISTSVFYVRYFLFLLPLFYVYVSYAAVNFKKKYGMILVVILVLLNIFALYDYYTEPKKPQWREAASFIEGVDADNMVLLFDRGAGGNRMIYDYYSKDPKETDKIDIATLTYRISESELQLELKKYKFAWLVLSKNKDLEYLDFMSNNYELVADKEYSKISIYLFRVE